MCQIRAVSLLSLVFISLQSNTICSACISSYLPQNESDLLSLAAETDPPPSTFYNQIRLFPDVTFNCSGSVVGWSMIANLSRVRGARPRIIVWQPSDGQNETYEVRHDSRLHPCMNRVISEEDHLYLYENITEEPVEFEPGDILGMLLPRGNVAKLTPYFVTTDSITAHYRNNVATTPVTLSNLQTDNMIPLLSLHICSRDDGDYDECLNRHKVPSSCLDITEIPVISPSATVGPAPTDLGTSDDSGVSSSVVAAAVAIPLSLTLLIISLILLLTLMYIGLSRRRTSAMNKQGVVTITTNNRVNADPQPYAEPSLFRSSPLPLSRSHTPLPPPPTNPPPPPGLKVQPTYAVLDGPSPSPPPPYLDLEHSRAPPLASLPSPEYESIDKHEIIAALMRQNATDNSDNSADYAQIQNFTTGDQ